MKRDGTVRIRLMESTQCFEVLKDIEDVIPSGSRKPDYSVRLRYAFGNEKKIQKHQEKLKQVQHMFMFMTTMWMYQLPLQGKPSQPSHPRPRPGDTPTPRDPGFFASDTGGELDLSPLSMASWRGVMQQVPVTIGGVGGVNYEATLTLNPIQTTQTQSVHRLQEEERQKRRSRTYERGKAKKEMEKKEQSTLENLRRSPYFSMALFNQPSQVTIASGSSGIGRIHAIEEVRRDRISRPIIVDEKKDKTKDEYERERARMEMGMEQKKRKEEDEERKFGDNILSEADAKFGVQDLMARACYSHISFEFVEAHSLLVVHRKTLIVQ